MTCLRHTNERYVRCVFHLEHLFRFAVERLEHAIVLWKLLVCELSCSPSTGSGRSEHFQRARFIDKTRVLLSISNVFYSVRLYSRFMLLYECVLIKRGNLKVYGRTHNIDNFSIKFFLRSGLQTGLKMSKVRAARPFIKHETRAIEIIIMARKIAVTQLLELPTASKFHKHVIYQSHRVCHAQKHFSQRNKLFKHPTSSPTRDLLEEFSVI